MESYKEKKEGQGKPADDLSTVISQIILQEQEGMEECWFLLCSVPKCLPTLIGESATL